MDVGQGGVGEEVIQESPARVPARRFAYVTEVDISIDNGPGINEREFVTALLDRHGDSVECVLPEPGNPVTHSDRRITYVASHQGTARGYGRYLLSAKHAIDSLLNANSVGTLIFRPGGSPLLPYYYGSVRNIPIFFKKLGLHAVFGPQTTRSWSKTAFSRSMFRLYRSAIRGAVASDVESYAYVEWLEHTFGIGRDRLVVIPNGVNTDVFKPSVDLSERRDRDLLDYEIVVGYVGALSRIRKVGALLNAFARLPRSKHMALVLVGGGVDEASLRAEAVQLGVQDRVRFAGVVPYSEVPSWMRCFDVAVDPTAVQMQTASATHLGSYSQKVGQYLASGLPVLAWRCPDTSFIDECHVGRTAVFPSEDSLADGLEELSELVARDRTDLSLRARSVAEARFDSRVLADRRVELWQDSGR